MAWLTKYAVNGRRLSSEDVSDLPPLEQRGMQNHILATCYGTARLEYLGGLTAEEYTAKLESERG